MITATDEPLTVNQRRRGRRLAYWNGAVWAIGNGLASTTLVIYLALELGAGKIGLGIALILAARHVVGLLRLGAPAIIGRLVDRKRFCLGAFLLSAFVLLTLPWIAAPGNLPSPEASLAALVGLWCVYHLLQYLATIALYSWLADLVPLRIRGRFLGLRQRWTVVGEAAAMLCGGLFVWGWKLLYPTLPGWIAYVIPACLGVGFFLAALIPLALIPRLRMSETTRHEAVLDIMLAPLTDNRFLRLLAFGCWFSLCNGMTGSAQNIYQARVLGLSLFVILALRTGMCLGQLSVSPTMGRLADRLGNRPVMIVSLLLVATGPLFYLAATPGQWWWLIGAWVVWIAYAGLNVCLPNLMLKLSPGQSNTPYIATYFTATGLCYAAGTIIGGLMLDSLQDVDIRLFGGAVTLDFYRYSFALGWITRSMGVLLLLAVIEGPGRRADDR